MYAISMGRCLANTQSWKGSSGIGGMSMAVLCEKGDRNQRCAFDNQTTDPGEQGLG